MAQTRTRFEIITKSDRDGQSPRTVSAGLPEPTLLLDADLSPHQASFEDSVSFAPKTEAPRFNAGMFMLVTSRGVRSTLTDAVHCSESLICDHYSGILVLRSCYASILGSLVSPLESPFAMLAGVPAPVFETL